MTGNENVDRTRNFFEQVNSSQRLQSQPTGGNWPILNNNTWVGIQGQNGMSLTSNSRNHTSQNLDSEQGNGTQSSQMPYGTNPTQLTPKKEFLRNQPRSQQLNLNGFVDFSPGLQQGKASEYSSAHTRSASGDAANIDFFSGQQQPERTQHPGISQPYSRQPQGFNDIQLWRQHMMFKQLQEIQRQHQLQDLGGRQQNSRSQQSDVARHPSIGQSLPLPGGTPIGDASNIIFPAGNMNWPQQVGPPMRSSSNGLMFSDDRGQTTTQQPMAFVPQHVDQSLYGTPVYSTRYPSNYYPPSQGLSHDCTNAMNKASGNRAENASMMHPTAFNYFQKDQGGISVANQGFQGKDLFRNATIQGPNSAVTSGNLQQLNHFSHGAQVEEFQGGQERENWSGNLQENEVVQVGRSRGVANLDPTEEKLLFGTGNDANWDGSFGESGNTSTGAYMQNDHFSAFPSIQSGSWSALMLDALDASSSDTGLQEEWGALSFQKTEPSTGNHSAVLNNNGKQQTTWDGSNLQSASFSTSRSFSLFNDADANPICHIEPNLQQSSTKFAHEQNERVSADISHKSSQHSPIEPFDNVSNVVWAGQMYNQSARHPADTEFSLQNRQRGFDHEHKMPMRDASSLLSGKLNGWNMNASLADNEDYTLEVPDNNEPKLHAQRDDIERTMLMERDHDDNMRSKNSYMGNFTAGMTSNALKLKKDIIQQVSHQHQLDYGKHVAVGSMNYKGDEDVARYQSQLSRGSQAKDSFMYSTDKNKGPGGTFDNKQESSHPRDVRNESYMSDHSQGRQRIDSETGAKENFLFAGNVPSPLVSSSKKSASQSGRKTSEHRRFHHHPMGNLEMDAEPVGSHNHASHSQDPYQSVVRGLKNQEQGYVGESQIAQHVVSYGGVDWGKGNFKNLQRNAKAAEEIQSRSNSPSHDSAASSYDVSNAHVSQNKRFGQTSHNMLELLHKVDQSRNNNTVEQINFSDHNTPSEIPEAAPSDEPACLQHDRYSALQGFGLKLAPPSQRQPGLDHDLPLQTSLQTANDPGSRNLESGARDKDGPWSSSTTSVPSLPLSSQSENLDNKPSLGNSSTVTASTLPHARNQSTVQQHHRSTGPAPMDQSTSLSSGRHDSSLRVTHESHEGTVSDQSARVASRISPFRVSPSVSQPINASSHPSNLTQKIPIVETKSGTQPSATSSISPQGGFSTMLHNVWKSVSAHRISVTQVQKIIPSLSPLPSHMDTDSWVPQKMTDELSSVKGESAQSEIGTCSINSQLIYGEEYPVKGNSSQHIPRENTAMPKHPSAGNSAVSMSSLDLHQQDLSRARPAQDPSVDSQKGHVPVTNVAPTNSDNVAYGHTLKSSDFHKQNYSLLQQVHAMKGADSDPSKRVEKRHKGADFSAEAPRMDWAARQRFIYGQKAVFGELGATSQHSSFPSDVKMLSFSSRDNEEKTADTSSMLEDLHDLQSHNHSHSKVSTSTSMIGSKRPQINSQMAPPSWPEQYGTYKNGQIIASYDGVGNSQRITKSTAQHHFFAKASENMDNSIVVEQRDDATQDSLRHSTSFTAIAANEYSSSSHCLPPRVIDDDVPLIPKKRKTATSELLPWHKEVTQGSQWLRSISTVELNWAQVANRLVEKVEDESEMIEDSSSVAQRRRRLILTTQLMHQLFPPIPATFLIADVTTSYESAMYLVARSALGDACSFISCLGSDSFVHSDGENMKSEKVKTSDKVRDHFLSKAMEVFIGRSRKLESDLLRLERISPISDARAECYDLDRCSIINRFAKFHGRAQIDRIQSSSTSETAPRPQKHVTAVATNGNLPSGVPCLSL